jgi:hypothetical protein
MVGAIISLYSLSRQRVPFLVIIAVVLPAFSNSINAAVDASTELWVNVLNSFAVRLLKGAK